MAGTISRNTQSRQIMLRFYVYNLYSTLIQYYLLPSFTDNGLVDNEAGQHAKLQYKPNLQVCVHHVSCIQST